MIVSRGVILLMASLSISLFQHATPFMITVPLGQPSTAEVFAKGVAGGSRVAPLPSSLSGGRRKVVVFMGRRAAKIANRKGKADAVRTKLYAAFGKKIIMAVKAGGADPETNRALSVLMKEAKAAGVPGDNVARAITRGSSANEADFKEATYEAYGYGGAGIIVNVLTDNTNRAKTEILTALRKTEVKLANPGSVAFNFDKKGLLELVGAVDEDRILEAALEADVSDVDIKGDEEVTRVYVEQSSLTTLRELLVGSGLECRSTSLVHVPKMLVDCTDEDFENNMLAIEALEDLDDVDSCEHNMNDEE